MDVILPYVAWITLLAVITDWLLAAAVAALLPLGASGAAQMSRIVVHAAGEELRRRARARARQPRRAEPASSCRLVGASGCGKIDVPAHPARPGAGRAAASSSSATGRSCREPTPRARHRLPALFGVPAPDRAARTCCSARDFALGRAVRPASSASGAGARARGGRGHAGARRPRRMRATSIRPRSRAACSSGSRSPRRCSAGRRCCCSTSRSARSIPASASRCTSCSPSSGREHGMTVFMVTHDIGEAFKLGTRVLVFDKVRHDPQFPSAYGATITYDLKLDRKNRASRRTWPRWPRWSGRPGRTQRRDDGVARETLNAQEPTRTRPPPRGLAVREPSSASTIPISTRAARRAGRRSRPRASCRRTAGARSSNGRSTWACPGSRVAHRQVDPDLRARRAAAFRRHQHLPQGALCRERARRRQVRRRGHRHPVRQRHHLPAGHPLRAAGHPPHLGALHALQLRARRRPARADDAVRRRRRLHHPGQPREELRPDHAAASATSPRRARCR